MAGEATLKMILLGEDRSAGKALRGVGTEADKSRGRLQGMASVAGRALAGGLLLAGAAAVKMTQAAADDAEGQAKLATVLRNVTGATDSQVAATEDWITAQGKALGMADDQLRPALAKLTAATGDVAMAQADASLAMDVAAGTGKDFGTVAEALAKAHAGNIGALGRLGIATKDADGKTKSLKQITKELADTYGGAASSAADTAAGKQKRMTLAFSEFQEELGAKLLPALSRLAEAGTAMIGWIDENQKVVGIAAAAITGLVTAVWAVNTAAKAYAATQAALNIVLSANPIGATVVGIGLLVGGLELLSRATRKSGDEVQYTLPKWQDYASTLDGVAAATSRATREMVLERLEKSGLLAQTQALNIADRDAVLAAMGNEAARRRVSAALGEAVTQGKNYEALQVAQRLGSETTAIESSRVAQLRKNLALAETREEAQRIQNKLDKLATTNANPQIRIDGAGQAINQLTAIQQLLNDVTKKKGGNAQAPVTGSVLAGVDSKRDNAVGTSFFSGGATWVGERGPEIAFLPRGTGIATADQSARMSASGGSGDLGTLTVIVQTDTGEVIEKKLVKVKRDRGNNRALAFV